MSKRVVILANGNAKNLSLLRARLNDCDTLVCADGGGTTARQMNIFPDYIVGDMDSISPEDRLFFEKSGKTEVIFDPNQNKTDTQLAIELALKMDPSGITFFGATGNRLDHTLANIFCLLQIPPHIKASIVDEHNEIFLVRDELEIQGKKDDIISILSLMDIDSLSYSGLHWNVQDEKKPAHWIGICNKMTGKEATVRLNKGLLLVIKSID